MKIYCSKKSIKIADIADNGLWILVLNYSYYYWMYPTSYKEYPPEKCGYAFLTSDLDDKYTTEQKVTLINNAVANRTIFLNPVEIVQPVDIMTTEELFEGLPGIEFDR